jgi:hypothetical protein
MLSNIWLDGTSFSHAGMGLFSTTGPVMAILDDDLFQCAVLFNSHYKELNQYEKTYIVK